MALISTGWAKKVILSYNVIYVREVSLFWLTLYTVELSSAAVTLGGANYDGGRTSPVGQQDHVICCSGWVGLRSSG